MDSEGGGPDIVLPSRVENFSQLLCFIIAIICKLTCVLGKKCFFLGLGSQRVLVQVIYAKLSLGKVIFSQYAHSMLLQWYTLR